MRWSLFFLLCIFLVFGEEESRYYTRQGTRSDELDKARDIFQGPLEVVSENNGYIWLESPLYHSDGYLLFTDVSWANEEGITCGMLYKMDTKTLQVVPFLRCSGLVGGGEEVQDLVNRTEGGSNGMIWGWGGEGDLVMCQHGRQRIVRFNVGDVVDGEIEDEKVEIVADLYKGNKFNSPNDLVLVGDTLYFTDPPFGNLWKDGSSMFERMSQPICGIYKIVGERGEVELVVGFPPFLGGYPYLPNGVVITREGNMVVPITSIPNPVQRVEVRANKGLGKTIELITPHRINAPPDLPWNIRLNDGLTYDPTTNLLYIATSGGVSIFDSKNFELLGFLRIDDVNSNNVLGGGYLWISARDRVLRVKVRGGEEAEGKGGEGDSPASLDLCSENY